MERLVWFLIASFYLLCFTEAVPQSTSESDSACGAPGMDIFACAGVQVFLSGVSLLCSAINAERNLAQILSCLSHYSLASFGSSVTPFFNGLYDGAKGLTVYCDPILDSTMSYQNEKCPSSIFPVLNSILAPMPIQASTTSACGNGSVGQLACAFVEIFYMKDQLLCKAKDMGISTATLYTCAKQKVAEPLQSFFSSIGNTFIDGGTEVGRYCEKESTAMRNFVQSTCPGLYSSLFSPLDRVVSLL